MSTTRHRLRRLGATVGCAALLSCGLGVAAGTAGAVTPPAPMCPSSTPNGRFVRFLYLQIMMRCPDASGAAYWTGRLDRGASRAGVADALDMSTENVVNNNVAPLYQGLLGRAPSSNELAAGIDSIRSTKSDADLISFIVSTNEKFATFSSFNEWLDFVYLGVLDRPSDTNGINFFNDYVSDPSTAGERRGVVKTLEHSPENAADWAGAAMGAAFNRAPDAGGMTYWTGWLQGSGHWQTFRMWTLMLSSQEGFNLAQTQPNPPPEESAPSAAAPMATH